MSNRKLEDFTFKDSGVTVKIKRVSPYLVSKMSEQFPPPEPPLQEVDYGDGKKRKEVNESDPKYIEEMRKYNIEFEKRMRKVIIDLGVVYELTDEDKKEVEKLRQYMTEEFDGELEDDDKVAFITYIAVGSDKDIEDLISAILLRSQPTEKAIEAAKNNFKS